MEKLSVEAKRERFPEARSFVEKELLQLDCPKSAMYDIECVLEELFLNVSNYAYNPEVGLLTIEVEGNAENSECSISITMSDKGKRFNPLEHKAPDVNLPLEQREAGGLGILLVKNLVTSVDYTYDNGCNRVTIKKNWRRENDL